MFSFLYIEKSLAGFAGRASDCNTFPPLICQGRAASGRRAPSLDKQRKCVEEIYLPAETATTQL